MNSHASNPFTHLAPPALPSPPPIDHPLQPPPSNPHPTAPWPIDAHTSHALHLPTPSQPLRILALAADHIHRTALGRLLAGDPAATTHFIDSLDALDRSLVSPPDVVLLDPWPQHFVENKPSLRDLTARIPSKQLFIVTDTPDPYRVLDALRVGIRGCAQISDPPSDIRQALRQLAALEPALTPSIIGLLLDHFASQGQRMARLERLSKRERQVINLLPYGGTYRAMAQALGISEGTIRTHITRIYDKLAVHSRSQAIALILGQLENHPPFPTPRTPHEPPSCS